MNVENKNDSIWKVWNFDICEDICYVKGFDLMEKITVKTKLNTSQRTDEVPTGIKIVESLEDFLEWFFYRKSFNRESPNFKNFLDETGAEYHYNEDYSILVVEYDDNENRSKISKRIKELCETYGFVNYVKVSGRAVLEVRDQNIMKGFGFESEPYPF